MNLRQNKYIKLIRTAINPTPVKASDVLELQEKQPELSIQEALDHASVYHGHMRDANRDELIRALLEQVSELTDRVHRLENQKFFL